MQDSELPDLRTQFLEWTWDFEEEQDSVEDTVTSDEEEVSEAEPRLSHRGPLER